MKEVLHILTNKHFTYLLSGITNDTSLKMTGENTLLLDSVLLHSRAYSLKNNPKYKVLLPKALLGILGILFLFSQWIIITPSFHVVLEIIQPTASKK